jgi:hypothetical protein
MAVSDVTVDTARWLDAKLGGGAPPPLVLVVGPGDGGLLDLLETRAPLTRVVALEPNPTMAARFRARRDWSSWSDRLTYLVGPEYEGADQAWRAFPLRDQRHVTLVHPALERNIDESVVRALRVLKEIVYGARANAEARRKFAPRYLANTLRNLPALLAGSDASALENAFSGLPAVVVGAGPSLDQNLEELRPLADRAVVIAADTALRPMLHAGVEPQFVAAVDPAALNAEHFERLPRHDRTWLVADPSLDSRAIAGVCDRAFWFRVSRHEPWPWLQALGVDVRQIDVWGSVLTAAFQTGVLLGCDPIVFIGADLSFTGGRPYARGTTFEFEWTRAVAAGAQLPELWQARLWPSGPDRLDAVDLRGEAVTTTQSLLSFRDWLLRQSRHCGRHVVNATGAGMFYGGPVVQSRLKDVLNGPVAIPSVDRIARVSPLRGATDVAVAVNAARHDVTVALSNDGAAARWMDFCGDGYDAVAVGDALGAATRGLSSSEPNAVQPFAPKAGLGGLPEREALLRAILLRYEAPEWAHSAEVFGACGDAAVRSAMDDACQALQRAFELDDEPFTARGDIFGADIEHEGGLAILGRRDWWSDSWRCLLWDYFDALAIASAAGVAAGDAAGVGALTTALDRIETAVVRAPRACCAADLRDVHDLVREGVFGYNLVDTTTACVAVALRLGPQSLPEIPEPQSDVWARQGLLLWAPSVGDMSARVRGYQKQIVLISMACALADIIGARGAADRCRRLAAQAAGVAHAE